MCIQKVGIAGYITPQDWSRLDQLCSDAGIIRIDPRCYAAIQWALERELTNVTIEEIHFDLEFSPQRDPYTKATTMEDWAAEGDMDAMRWDMPTPLSGDFLPEPEENVRWTGPDINKIITRNISFPKVDGVEVIRI